MFQQMDESTFKGLLGVFSNNSDTSKALKELHLYRELGTLQQLSYATEISKQLNEIKCGINQLLFYHYGRLESYTPTISQCIGPEKP